MADFEAEVIFRKTYLAHEMGQLVSDLQSELDIQNKRYAYFYQAVTENRELVARLRARAAGCPS